MLRHTICYHLETFLDRATARVRFSRQMAQMLDGRGFTRNIDLAIAVADDAEENALAARGVRVA